MGFKLKEFSVRNFRSLANVAIKDFGDLNIFIGGNSSGKSNLIEAISLLFNEFDPAPQRPIGAVSDYLWFDRVSDRPIEFQATVELGKEDLSRIVPDQLKEKVKIGETNTLSVTRHIMGNAASATWETKAATTNGIEIIKDGQLKVTAPDTEILGRVLQGMSQFLKGAFKTVLAARDYTGPSARFGDRVGLIQPAHMGELTTLGQSLEKPKTDKWAQMEDFVTRTSSDIQDVRVISGQIMMRESGSALSIPIWLEGGGHQGVLSLVYQLTREEGIFGLEEPEMHLHPHLSRKLFDVLKEVSRTRQILISTHSTVFVDYAEPKDTWIVRRKGKETEVTKIGKPQELTGLLYELGIRPSDIFFANGIVFVEGDSDRVVLQILAKKIRPEFEKYGLSVIPIHGKAKGAYHLNVWVDAAKSTRIPFFMVLDKDASKEAKKLTDDLISGENLFLLEKGSMEDYYPGDKLTEVVSKTYTLQLNEDDKKRILETPRSQKVEDFLKHKKIDPKGWKVIVGREVAQMMTVNEIDDEIKRIIERISTVLAT